MVKELEKLIESTHYIQYNKNKDTFDGFKKAFSIIEKVIEHNHFLNSKKYKNELDEIEKIYNDELSSAFTSDSDAIIHRTIQKKTIILARTILDENKKIFVVHGRNVNMRDSITSLLGRLKLDYVVLANESNRGATVIEKFQREAEDCRYAIVLFSCDDIGRLSDTSNENLKHRARQNVVLELGYFLGRVGRRNIVVIHQHGNEIERPSDFDGVVYEPFDEFGAWKTKIINEMKKSGIYIDSKLAERA